MPDIEDVKGLSADARRLFDWMTAAFTGDVNEALADARSSGASISKWDHDRLRAAHVELKKRGAITADAPDLESPARHHSTRKSPAQLDAEIAEALAHKAAFEEAKRDGALLQAEVDAADVPLNKFPRNAMGLVVSSPEYRAARARFQMAFARLRAFNATFTKRFAKELRAERDKRYGR